MINLEEICADNMSNFLDMYEKYLIELRDIDEVIKLISKNEMNSNLLDGEHIGYYIWKNKTIIGFIVIGTSLTYTLSRYDIYIQDFYILPEYRKQSNGENAVKKLMSKFSNKDFSALILRKNLVAISFWDNVFEKNKYLNRTNMGNIDKKENCKFTFRYWIKQ